MFTFFKKSIFGLDISDYSIEIVSLGGLIKEPKLLAMSRETLGSGIIKNGKVLQKEKLAHSLKNLIENPQFGKIKTKKFIFSLPESKSFVHTFKIPEVLRKETIEKKIELQVIQNFPFSLKDLYFDFKINNKEVFLIATKKHIVEYYLVVVRELQLKPIVLEIESLSLGRSLIKNRGEITLIVDIGANTTNFSIFDKNGLKLSITINTAGNKFSRVLAEKLKISFSKAESIKKEVGLDPNKREGKPLLVLQKEIQKIVSEIKKIDEYFLKKEGKSFERIILAGGSSSLPNLAEYLAENLEMSVIIGNPWDKINIDILKTKEHFKKALKVSPILYATVIGSALRGLAKNPEKADINLIKNLKT